VATRFAENPYVLGYELINEPFLGDIYAQPSLLLPGRTDKEYLAPLYQRLHAAIRTVDNDHIIFFEPCVFDEGQSGFEEGPGGPDYNDRQVYSYHIYCGSTTDKQGNPTNMYLCNETDALFVKEKMVVDQARMGVAGFLTEFGAVNVTDMAIEDLHLVASYADQHLQSWTYWQLKYFK
jgi:endoglycosylceramidase